LESILVDVDEVVEIVQVNLNLASSLMQNDDSDEDINKVLILIHDGLDRAAKRSAQISSKAARLIQNIK
jgi:hypothetical protein